MQHLSPNILLMISAFNHVSSWIASCIVMETTSRDRAALISSFIQIAQVNNFPTPCKFFSVFCEIE